MRRFASIAPIIAVAVITLPSAVSAQAAPDGKTIFRTRCAACHVDPASTVARPALGPGLRGVVGRNAAGDPQFDRYSAAMRKVRLRWDTATLDRYLTRPSAVVPGTTMVFPGLSDAAQRSAIITYLTAPK